MIVVVLIYAGVVFGAYKFLISVNQPWTTKDWATNVIFALFLAGLTSILASRQGNLQQALAEVAITEKISSIFKQMDEIRKHIPPSACHQLLTETRAGFYMYKYADSRTQSELIRTTEFALKILRERVHDSIYPFAFWDNEDWEQVRGAARLLREQLEKLSKKNSWKKSINKSIINDLVIIESITSMPYEVFLKAYRDRNEGREIRIVFNWDVLEQALHNNEACIEHHSKKIEQFFVGKEVFAPWHFSRNEKHVSHSSEEAFKLGEIGRINEWWSNLQESFRTRTLEIQKYLANQPKRQRPVIEVVTLQINPVAYLVLDGNHRLSAAKLKRERYRNEIPVDVSEYRIIFNEPEVARMTCIDARMLSDYLAHHNRAFSGDYSVEDGGKISGDSGAER